MAIGCTPRRFASVTFRLFHSQSDALDAAIAFSERFQEVGVVSQCTNAHPIASVRQEAVNHVLNADIGFRCGLNRAAAFLRALLAVQEAFPPSADATPEPLVYYIIHSLPIESWVVDDEAIPERDRKPLGLFRSGSKWVRSGIGDPRFE